MKFTIHPIDNSFAVKQGDLEIGRWPDPRQAKAARGALETALRSGVNPALGVFIALQAATDDALVNSYDDSHDENFVSGENA